MKSPATKTLDHAFLCELAMHHPVLDAGVLRNWEKAATFFMRQSDTNPTLWSVDCTANALCSHGCKHLKVPVIWNKRRHRFHGYPLTMEADPITADAAEAIGLLLLKHVTGLSVRGRPLTTPYPLSSRPDWVCETEGDVYLENSGTRNPDDLKNRLDNKLKKLTTTEYRGLWLFCISHVSGFVALFRAAGTK